MTNNLEHIHIFKSNIKTDADKHYVKSILDQHPLIEDWSVDLDDEDRVLRVISNKLTRVKIMELISICGYTCEELKN